jgi:hypothetical protein
MKYIKTYENMEYPQVGDYVLTSSSYSDELNDFLNNTIGKVTFKSTPRTGHELYDRITVKYSNIPINLDNFFNKI